MSVALDASMGRAQDRDLAGPKLHRLLQERRGMATEPEEHRKVSLGSRVHSQACSTRLLQEVFQESIAADVPLLPSGSRL